MGLMTSTLGVLRGPPLDGTPCWKMGLMASTLGVLRGPPLDGTACWKMGLMTSTLGVLRGLTLQVFRESNGTRRSPTRMAYFSSTAARQVLTYTTLRILE